MFAKRLTALFLMIVICFGSLAAYLFTLASDGTGSIREAIARQHEYNLHLEERRGPIYDCNMQLLTNEKRVWRAIVEPNVFADKQILLRTLVSASDRSEQELLRLIQKNRPFVLDISGRLEPREGIKLYETPARYQTPQLAPSVIGYLDSAGNGAMGMEKAFDGWLKGGGGEVLASFKVNAASQTLSGLGIELKDTSGGSRQGVVLTLDKYIQAAAEEAAEKYMDSGAIVVTEVATGKIRALVSVPTFTANNIEDYLNSENGEFLNRAFLGYNLGSVFKIVVMAAALESYPELAAYKYTCTGSITVGGKVFNCHQQSGHGHMDFTSAFGESCNTYFISLAQKVGPQKILDMAKTLGLGSPSLFAPGLSSQSGNLPSQSELSSPALIGNLAIGQGSLLVTPIQVAGLINSVAGYGLTTELSLVEGLAGSDGIIAQPFSKTVSKRVLKTETAVMIRKMMVEAVENGTGKAAKPEAGGAGGKTATAETGWIKNGQSVVQAWFAGFYPSWRPMYSIVVLSENGQSGGKSAAPVFKQIADALAARGE